MTPDAISNVKNIPPIGILGGTFDPIHNGHLRLAQEAIEQCGMAGVLFVPAGTPPHRDAPLVTAQQRLDMVRLALHRNPTFILDEREVHSTEPCYTVDSLTALRANFGPERPLCLLMGCDAFLFLHTWHEWKHLFDLAHIVVMQRAGGRPLGNAIKDADEALRSEYHARLAPSSRALLESPAGTIFVAGMPALEISATDIRRRCSEQKEVRYLLPDAVAHYIQHHQLYT